MGDKVAIFLPHLPHLHHLSHLPTSPLPHLPDMSSIHDLRLITLSIAIAIFASYTALDLAARVTAAKASAKVAWLIGGAMVMGIGIWSMHFVAMLAFSMAI